MKTEDDERKQEQNDEERVRQGTAAGCDTGRTKSEVNRPDPLPSPYVPERTPCG